MVRLQEQAKQEQERVRFEMFKSLMDSFLEERTKADQDKKQLQLLLAQATKVKITSSSMVVSNH